MAVPDQQWASGHSDQAKCLTCERSITSAPKDCAELRHHRYYAARRERNNAYRREIRAAAREDGAVYRKGRGRPENKAAYQRQEIARFRGILFDRLGSRVCVRCGFSDTRALQFDHRNGGGRAHRRSMPGGMGYLRHLMSLTPEELAAKFQVLCANCNTIKRLENGEHA